SQRDLGSRDPLSEKPQTPFGRQDREGFFHALRSSEAGAPQTFDICVIGGGITGAAIARDAAMRGLDVLLVEKNDFAWGTSSRSSKLVHGGVRYLENLEFKLVFESTQERALLWKNAPDLCRPIPFLFPAYRESRLPLFALNIGLWLYDILSTFRSPSLHKQYSADECRRREPALKQKNLRGAIFYWDGATDDALLTLANVIDARDHGATCLSRVEVKQIEWRAPEAHLVHFEDQLSGERHQVRARVVIGATGPWTDRLHDTLRVFDDHHRMAPTRGSHIVVKKEKLPLQHAVVMTHPEDGRVLFAIPWHSHTVIGTTDLFDDDSPDSVRMIPSECDYLIHSARHFFPDHPLAISDIVSTWTGLRPLLAPPKDATASEVSRDHELKWDERGYLYITGGKLTTHREMAKQAVDKVLERSLEWLEPLDEALPRCPTKHAPFPSLPQIHQGLVREFSLDALTTEESALVREMIRTQMILHLEDLLVRRTEIFYKHEDNGVALIPSLRTIFCEELGLNERQWAQQVMDYQKYLEHNIQGPLGRRVSVAP
ncbi:MAG TPA: glycerol-3-phosphate dehydrogenase/oxidase, partial [Bdellovibrionota bacterium]|nr:glycerol-3-phosphate dehydrogenase/oxidase [Bdellovibrionota bacterium]